MAGTGSGAGAGSGSGSPSKSECPPFEFTLWVSDMWSLSSSENSDWWSICVPPAQRTRCCLVPGLEGTTPSFSTVSLSITVDEMTGTTDGLCSLWPTRIPKSQLTPWGRPATSCPHDRPHARPADTAITVDLGGAGPPAAETRTLPLQQISSEHARSYVALIHQPFITIHICRVANSKLNARAERPRRQGAFDTFALCPETSVSSH